MPIARPLSIAAALALAGSAAAQQGKPLGDLLDTLPPAETEVKPEPARPAAAPAPRVAPGQVGTAELPPSRAQGLAPSAEAEEAPPPPEADAAWAAAQERRRAEINAVEGPLVEALNAEMAARQAQETRRIEAEMAEHRRRVAEHARRVAEVEAERERRDAEHRAEVERHRREYERRRALYEACLAGDRSACPPR